MRKIIPFVLTGLVAAALLALAVLAAPAAAGRAAHPIIADVNFYRRFFTVAVAIALVTPAFCLFVLQRRDGPARRLAQLLDLRLRRLPGPTLRGGLRDGGR
jgi:hypothetical protein